MRSVARSLWIMAVVALAVVALAGVAIAATPAAAQTQAQDQAQNQWRYTFYNGQWWYWLPENRWVYWRDNRWNDYHPQTFVASNAAGFVPGAYAGSMYGNQAVPGSDIRPFYGHAVSQWGNLPQAENAETGPFYGRAMPGEVFGGWGWRRSSIRPFYGHAISPY